MAHDDLTYVTTRKLTMHQIEQVGIWLKGNLTGRAYIRGAAPQLFIQQYTAAHDGNRSIHVLKVHFTHQQDANHFMAEWA